VVDFSSFCNSQVQNIRSLVLSLCNEGYFLFYFIGHGVLSAPMTNDHIDGFVVAMENALHETGLVG
jgi:hypothetical protein